jgi:hypothetical protein
MRRYFTKLNQSGLSDLLSLFEYNQHLKYKNMDRDNPTWIADLTIRRPERENAWLREVEMVCPTH